ncbi:hypothetical protein EDD70_2536 [Hydrogenoanaerobacterium saccharovorans]|uniref:Uncharacterized protein n=2 Tax=Hydrogenoanaerobacterium saccharovorans TaxID=474960 RepID=A0A1H8DGC0_9FIRM|nr:hypothetical protein [Hydrogenoanaerobacterium saccharovorans]RPF42197.1 hypothetical protein EDD70_2536 [Hydrogenoanaerobacterium saccharovorans]SEN06320.1 hypothetical protein SAMN05216180_2597 [Hydrogenoanaerobacterium saccharovorans]
MNIKKRIAKLVNVKSIVTILLTLVFAYQFCAGTISENSFMEIFKLIVIFYFGTQIGKAGGE